jgi:hypothetical protein
VKGLGAILLAALALVASGCGGERAAQAAPAKRACPAAWRAEWQALANRIDAPVYCPTWMPQPIDARIGGQWNTIRSVSRDRSYLMGFAWQELGNGSGEVHVNLRGFPGKTAIPRCPDTLGGHRRLAPCFSDPNGRVRANGIVATRYTVNQGADQWHVLYAWQLRGSLYTISEHVAKPLTYRKVDANLARMLRTLVLLRPET